MNSFLGALHTVCSTVTDEGSVDVGAPFFLAQYVQLGVWRAQKQSVGLGGVSPQARP